MGDPLVSRAPDADNAAADFDPNLPLRNQPGVALIHQGDALSVYDEWLLSLRSR